MHGPPGSRETDRPDPSGSAPRRGLRRVFRPRARISRPHHTSYWLVPLLILLGLGLAFAALSLSGTRIRLPVWAVAEVEARINAGLSEIRLGSTGRPSVALGGAEVVVDHDWVPRVRLEDVRLMEGDGRTLLTLPDLRLAFDPAQMVRGRVRLQSLRVTGAALGLTRLADGRFDIALAGGAPMVGFGGIVRGLVDLFDQPALSSLREIGAEGLVLTVRDQRAGRIWTLNGGTVALANGPDRIAAEVGVTLAPEPDATAARRITPATAMVGQPPARAHLSLTASKADASARLEIGVADVTAADIAAQADVLAFLRVLDARVSGTFTSALDGAGRLSALDAGLSIGAGALRPVASASPVAFDAAKVAFSYDPVRERIEMREMSVQSASLRVTATGQAYLPGAAQGLPREMLAQISFSDVQADPEGLFTEPAHFDRGALDLRLRLDPFSVRIGQLSLSGGNSALHLSGEAEAGANGWRTAIDVGLDRITLHRLLALWPPSAVPGTRDWVAENVQEGDLSDVRAALRIVPGQEPRFALGYEFDGADVTFLKSMPPIRQGVGYNTIQGRTYTLVVNRGHVDPPEGGPIDVAGSVLQVRDITEKPARAEIDLHTEGSLTATLSLLDQPPFEFIGKAKLPVTLGEGSARLRTRLVIPLKPGLHVADVSFETKGEVRDVTSDELIPGRMLASDRLSIAASAEEISIGGPGTLDGVPFDGIYRQRFGPEADGRSEITGTAELSASAVEKLRLGLPQDLISGKGQADLTVSLSRDAPPALRLTSTLAGVGLSIPALGWSKPASATGRLTLDATLGGPARVRDLTLDAAGLKARGEITLKADGTLDRATFGSVKLGGWLDAPVTLSGRGAGTAPGVSVNGGSVDLRRLPRGSAGSGGGEVGTIPVTLDRLTVSEGIALTRFRGTLRPGRSGLAGDFTGSLNGKVGVAGALAPSAAGTAVRIRANDAGRVFAAAGIFPDAGGGSMDLSVVPLGPPGTYDGTLRVQNVRIRNAPALAELVNAISVVGLLDQLQASGILFSEVDADFRLTPDTVRIVRGSAVGASLGVSAAGVVGVQTGALALQGVVSPIYFLNSIGSVLTRKGEGLFGFNYTVGGTAKSPSVSVNPLSILTPGMFREIFRTSPPAR